MFRFLREALDKFSHWRAVSRAARDEAAAKFQTPRLWKFVNAHGPQQSLAPRPMSHDEAVKFCREIIGYGYVQTDFAGSIIFFAGPKHAG